MIPFLDLKVQYRTIKDEVRPAIDQVLESASFALGPAVAEFERKFAAYVGTRHAIGVNSGTSALHLALLVAGVGPGDEVIVPAMTFVATAAAVKYAGARPVLVDVEPAFYTIDPGLIEKCLTPRTKAIIPVHLYGQPADMDPILEVARRRGLRVIEDAAQAHGAEYKGRRCGSIGDLAAFSFYPGKNLGAYGEGGLVATDDDAFAARVRVLRDWGQEVKGRHDHLGFNYRMEGIQGAVLGVKMNYLEAWTEARRRAAATYDRLLAASGIEVLAARGQGRHVYHIYPAMVKNRDAVRKAMEAQGVQTGVHYPLPIHLQPCFASLGYAQGQFPVAERVAQEELSLPIYPELTEAQTTQVVKALMQSVEGD